MKLRTLSASMMLASAGLMAQPASANISDNVIRIGFITDMASVYSDIDGAGGIALANGLASVAGLGFLTLSLRRRLGRRRECLPRCHQAFTES